MAQITASSDAPSEKVHYLFANDSFDLDPKGSYKTDDTTVIEAAALHPWLTVVEDEPVPATTTTTSAPVEPKAPTTSGVEN